MKETNLQKSKIPTIAGGVLLSCAVALAGSPDSFAGGRAHSVLSPKWMRVSEYSLQNNSFLNDVRSDLFQKRSLTDQFFSRKQAKGLRQQYQDLTRDQENRRRYGLMDPDSQAAYAAKLADFGHGVLDQVRAKEVENDRKKVIGVSHDMKADEVVSAVAKDAPKPVMVVATIAYAAYSGTPVKLELDPQTHISARANVSDGTGQIALHSPLFDSAFDVAANNPATQDEIAGRSLTDGTLDRYRVSVSRKVPGLDVTSGVSYGTTTTTLAASLSKPLAKNTVVVFDSLHPLTSMDQSEERFRLLYGVHF